MNLACNHTKQFGECPESHFTCDNCHGIFCYLCVEVFEFQIITLKRVIYCKKCYNYIKYCLNKYKCLKKT